MKTLLLITFLVLQSSLALTAEAQGVAGPDTYGTTYVSSNLTYVPLEPLPGLEEAQSGTGDFGALVGGFFRLLVNVGAFVAVTVLVIGGITYMVSEATVTKFVAKEKIKAAFWGLAILAGAWLVLNTINPDLLRFNRDLLTPKDVGIFITQGSSRTIEQSRSAIEQERIRLRAAEAERILLQQKNDTLVQTSGGQPLTLRTDGAHTEANLTALEEFTRVCEEEGNGEVVGTPLISPGAFDMPTLWTCEKI